MNYQPFRAFMSLWLIICMLFSLTPLGCHSAKVRHANGWPGQPHVPAYTAEQLQECVELLEPGRHSVDAKVELDEDGRVLDVTTTGAPNPDVGMCIRVALRDMQVSKDVIDDAALRTASSSLPNSGTNPNREHMGEIVTITIVTIIFADVIVEAAVVALGVAVTATVVAGAANASQAKSAPARKPHQPDHTKWKAKGGTIQDNPDGSRTFTRKDGVSVTYDKDGFPDFTPYRHPTVKDVQLDVSVNTSADIARADKLAGITKEKRDLEGYSWHHHQDGKTMQLIKLDVHLDFFHTGGMSRNRKR